MIPHIFRILVRWIFSHIDLSVNHLLHNQRFPDFNFNFLFYVPNFVSFKQVNSWILLAQVVDACFSYQLVHLKFIITYYWVIQARFKPTNFILNQKNAYHIQNVDFWMKTYRKHRNLILAIMGNSWYIQLSFRSKSIKIFSLIEEKIFWDYEEI